MAYAKGKYALGMCDICGFTYPYLDLRKQWNNYKACPECFDPKQPQLDPTPQVLVAEALYNPTPDQAEIWGRGKVTTEGPDTTADIIGTIFPNTLNDPFKMTGELGTLTITTS